MRRGEATGLSLDVALLSPPMRKPASVMGLTPANCVHVESKTASSKMWSLRTDFELFLQFPFCDSRTL